MLGELLNHPDFQRGPSQETDIVVAMATRIYEVGAIYHSVEPDVFEVTSLDGTGETTLMCAHQFHTVLSLIRSMKSFATIPVY
jgi:hypothetical protein